MRPYIPVIGVNVFHFANTWVISGVGGKKMKNKGKRGEREGEKGNGKNTSLWHSLIPNSLWTCQILELMEVNVVVIKKFGKLLDNVKLKISDYCFMS